MEFVKVYNFS